MMRPRGREIDLSELLQFSDAEVGDPSTDDDNHREPELEPKHKIFLSHSGAQKDFTEQLCVDLERWQYYPFFDKRSNSLPKGRKYPELIFQAAQQCEVAVLILSEEFFTRSKWPMLELEAFVDAQKQTHEKLSILPVYLGISRDECTKNEAKRLEWVTMWRNWAETDTRIDVEKWKDALRVLGPSNGIEYVRSLGEVMLRKEIVNAIRCLVQPENMRSVGQIEGRAQICKAIIEKFTKTKPSSLYGVRVVGIHGMGGVGKTTFCKLLCDELSKKYEGKVCHGELGVKSPLEMQKQVLRELTDISHESLTNLTHDMTTNLLNRRVHQQPVFLALDNVWPEFVDEAKVYLQAGYCQGSMVMVTARSIDLLARLHIAESDCLEMPELEEEDAKRLFLHHATPGVEFLSEHDEEDILYCVRQCKFRKGANMGEHFHPLSLKVLGAQLGSLGLDPKMWVENLVNGDKFNQFGEREHAVFSILRRGYDSLRKEDQLLFMDSVLFLPQQSEIWWLPYDFSMPRVDIYGWLSIVHRIGADQIMVRLKGLKAKSLIEGIGDCFDGISIHDLYLEFAKLEVKRDDSWRRRWVWYDEEEAHPPDVLVMSPPGHCWGNLERVFVRYDYKSEIKSMEWSKTMHRVKWKHFSNVVVLELLIGKNEVLDLRGLRCLRSLKLRWGYKLFEHDYSRGEGKLDGLGDLINLGWLELWNIHYAPCMKEIGCLTSLRVLRLRTCYFYCKREALPPPKFDMCIHLQELVLDRCGCLKAIPNLRRMTSLRKVVLRECGSMKEVVGLNPQMRELRELELMGCGSLRHVHGLEELDSLHILRIQYCPKVGEVINLHKLTNLQQLRNTDAYRKVLGFSESMPLEELVIGNVEGLPELDFLRKVRMLSLVSFDGAILPPLGKCIALENLKIKNMSMLRDLPILHNLSMLQRLSICHAPKVVLHAPILGEWVTLKELELRCCGTSVSTAMIPDLHKLTNLQKLNLWYTPIKYLPNLKCLIQLRVLNCSGTHLTHLPDLTGLNLMESIDLSRCSMLTKFENLASLPFLEQINLWGCNELTNVSNLANLPALGAIDVCNCPKLTSLDNLANMPTLKYIYISGCDILETLETLSGLKSSVVLDRTM